MPDRMNLVLFAPETVRADAVLGPPDERAKTPNLDELAAEGSAFTSCFSQSAYCAPARCTMFTGLYPHTAGHRSLVYLLRAGERNLFRDLKDAGYRNVVFGKNDLLAQDSIPLCFDEVAPRTKPQATPRASPWPPGHRHHRSFYWGPRSESDARDADWASIESALDFLDKPHERPFCLYLPLHFAHPPYRVEEPYFSMHPRDEVPAPIPARVEGKRSYVGEFVRFYGAGGLDESDLREIKATYFGMVSRLDHQLGLVVRRLKERGLYENTAVVVLSDHGDYTGDYGLVEKFLAGFEDCLLRVPLVVRAPGLGAGRTLSPLCELTDLYPTLMELLGLAPKHYHFGRSLVLLMRGETGAHRDSVFAEGGYHADEDRFPPPLRVGTIYDERYKIVSSNPRIAAKAAMIRTEAHKYVYAPADVDELYLLEPDPQELDNVAERPDLRPIRDRLRERLLRWLLDTADTLPLDKDPRGWRPERRPA
jgi:arylsulfatase A-like enzyme